MTTWKWCYTTLLLCFYTGLVLWWIWPLLVQQSCTCMISLISLLKLSDAGAKLPTALSLYSVHLVWQQHGSTLVSSSFPILSMRVGSSSPTFSTAWASSLSTSSISIYAYCSCCMCTGLAYSSRLSQSLQWAASYKSQVIPRCSKKKRSQRRTYELNYNTDFHTMLFLSVVC